MTRPTSREELCLVLLYLVIVVIVVDIDVVVWLFPLEGLLFSKEKQRRSESGEDGGEEVGKVRWVGPCCPEFLRDWL